MAIGVVAVALGLVLHLVWLALVGAVVIVVGAAQWFYRRRGAGLPAVTAIAVEGLVKRYGGFTAVEDVGFEVAQGQVTALLGPNGAGKTTDDRDPRGIPGSDRGIVRVLGVDPRTGGRAWRARIGLVPAEHEPGRPAHGDTEALSLFGALTPTRFMSPRCSTSST